MSENNSKKIEREAFTPSDVAYMFQMSEGTLANMRCRRTGPRFYKVGRKVLYFKPDLEIWSKANPIQTIDSVRAER